MTSSDTRPYPEMATVGDAMQYLHEQQRLHDAGALDEGGVVAALELLEHQMLSNYLWDRPEAPESVAREAVRVAIHIITMKMAGMEVVPVIVEQEGDVPEGGIVVDPATLSDILSEVRDG